MAGLGIGGGLGVGLGSPSPSGEVTIPSGVAVEIINDNQSEMELIDNNGADQMIIED